jgi:hypothetical protein
LASDAVFAIFLRLLANYDAVHNGSDNPFGSDFPLFWGILGLMAGLYFILLSLKYICLYIALLSSNTNIHKDMVNGIVRSPAAFFDSVPSGILMNKFSNDLNILDNSMVVYMIDTL